MKKVNPLFFILFTLSFAAQGQPKPLFDDSKVPSIYIEMPADSLQYMMANLVNDFYIQSRFIFDDGTLRDTVEQTGIRLRGNTSLGAQKKSFKLSFNEFVDGRKYQGVKKLNLRGSHNDPTMVREKLFYEVWASAGMPKRRVNFVKLYINSVYRGLYSNIEEIDKEWLGDEFPENEGNLYKCTWPANLAYSGGSQNTYKNIMHDATTRAYELQTNEAADDYTDLVALITALNKPINAAYEAQILQILNVESVLKAFAIDVATGNWDDYFYNKNNYYLYHNLESGRFEFITFDADNTFGVDWLGKDWATRDCLDWYAHSDARPLATQLLAVPAFKDKFVHYLDTLTRFVTHPDVIFPRIDALETLITPAAEADVFRTLDYGYTVSDFHNGFDQTIDGHTPYGIKPFLGLRYDSTLQQIQGYLTGISTTPTQMGGYTIYPNPVKGEVFISSPFVSEKSSPTCEISDVFGNKRTYLLSQTTPTLRTLSVGDLPQGFYFLVIDGAVFRIVKVE